MTTLLYCLNGIVMASHDSDQQVDAASYGTGVRVIPYAEPLITLDRIGAAPVWPQRDTRPYAQPAETTETLTAYASQARWEAVTVAGITFNGIPVKTDRVSQSQISNLAQYVVSSSIALTTVLDFTQDGVAYSITAQDAIDMNNQIVALIQQCRTIEAACIADLISASPTIVTYDDVDARFAGVMRSRTRKK
jgi:hypothetical protein